MRTISFLLITLCVSLQVFATEQTSDRIIYNGKEYSFNANPLESYFEKHPDKRPKSNSMSSDLWRGYISTFEIKDSLLFLKDIKIEVYEHSKKKKSEIKLVSVRNKVFPNQKIVKIDWETGLFLLPIGKITNYVYMGYVPIYENYILLEIHEGVLIREKRFTGEQYERFREEQLQAFKETDEYEKTKEDLKNKGRVNDIEFLLNVYLINFTPKILIED